MLMISSKYTKLQIDAADADAAADAANAAFMIISIFYN